MTEHKETTGEGKKRSVKGIAHTTWITVEYLSVRVAEALGVNVRIMREEADLFVGATLTLLGLLNWSSSKYCDGNTADYLSCTRPTTYYYYGWFEIALVILGTLLVLVLFVKNRRSR